MGSLISDAGYKKLDAETGYWNLDIGNWISETGYWKLDL